MLQIASGLVNDGNFATSAKTGIRYVSTDARVEPTLPTRVPMNTNATPVPNTADLVEAQPVQELAGAQEFERRRSSNKDDTRTTLHPSRKIESHDAPVGAPAAAVGATAAEVGAPVEEVDNAAADASQHLD